MSFIGNVPAESYSPVVKDTFSGDDSTTDFTLSIPATTNSVNVYVENVAQEPTDAYTISGTTLSFTAAPVTGTDNIYVIHRGPAVQQVVPPAGVAIDASTVSASGDISTEGDLKVEVASGGIYTITGTDTASNRTLTLPDEAGTVLTSVSTLSNTFDGTISSSATFPLEINKVADISSSTDNGTAGLWPGASTETVNLDTLSLWDSTNHYLNFSSDPGYYIIMWVGSTRLTATGTCKIQFDGGDGTFRDEISRTLNNINPGSLCTPIT